MKRLFKYIFIPVLAILLMSHNVFATTANIAPGYVRVHRVQRNNFNNANYENYTFNIKNDRLGFAVAVIGQNWSIRSISLPLNTTIKKDSYYTMSLTLVNSYVGTLAGLGCNKIDSVSYVQGTTSDTTIYVSGHVVCDVTNLEFGDNNNPNMVFLHGTSTEEGIWIFQPKINFFEYQDQAAESLKEAQKDTQEAADNSSTAADNNSTNQTTSNLLGVFGSFVTALTSISPSNCNVDFDLGHIDFGVQNLCSQPVPQAFTVVTSIIVVCFTIPFVVHLIRRILSLIREMQT